MSHAALIGRFWLEGKFRNTTFTLRYTTRRYTPLHCATLNDTALHLQLQLQLELQRHYITLRYANDITLHYATLHYTTLRYSTLTTTTAT